MAEEKRSFKIKVEGQYYGAHEATGAPTVKFYTAEFVLPSQEAALSIICKHLLDPYLRKHYADYAKFRSHKIVNVVVVGRQPDPSVLRMAFEDMGVSELSDFCILKRIFIDPYKHEKIDKCREEIRQIWEARVSQEKADKTTGLAKEKKEADELLAMNDLQAVGEGAEINPNAQRIAGAMKKADKDIRASDVPADGAAKPEEDLPPLPPADDGDLLG